MRGTHSHQITGKRIVYDVLTVITRVMSQMGAKPANKLYQNYLGLDINTSGKESSLAITIKFFSTSPGWKKTVFELPKKSLAPETRKVSRKLRYALVLFQSPKIIEIELNIRCI